MPKVRGGGYIEKRGKNIYLARLPIGRDPLTGKYQRISRTIHGTKADALRVLAQMRHEIESGLKVDADKLTLADFADMFHSQRCAMKELAPTTEKRDAQIISCIKRYMGDIPLRELDSTTIKRVYVHLRENEILSPDGLHKLHVKLKQILREAVNSDLILRNPCDRISVPRAKRAERLSLSKSEASRLLRVLNEEELSARITAIRLGLATGMRRGEVLGLLWEQVDLDEGYVEVKYSYSTDKTLRQPKSASSRRVIALDAQTVAFLAAWKERQAQTLSGLWTEQSHQTAVITDELGGLLDPDNFTRWFQDFCVAHNFGSFARIDKTKDAGGQTRTHKTGYVGLRFHELRHTQATLLIADGVDIKTVQNRLGHSSASLTLNLYAHATVENDRKAADLFGSLLVS